MFGSGVVTGLVPTITITHQIAIHRDPRVESITWFEAVHGIEEEGVWSVSEHRHVSVTSWPVIPSVSV